MIDLNKLVEEIIGLRKKVKKVAREGQIAEYLRELESIINEIEDYLLYCDGENRWREDEICDKVFLKLCEVALTIYHARKEISQKSEGVGDDEG
ncbi:hypothetical protein JCM9492_11340 [Aquifex pyrophilus]